MTPDQMALFAPAPGAPAAPGASPWHTRPVVALDFETTGPEPATCLPVSYALAVVAPDGTVCERHGGLVDPGVDVPAEAVAVHGITRERAAAEGVSLDAMMQTLAERLLDASRERMALVIFNARFDYTLLVRLGRERRVYIPPTLTVVDPMLIDRALDKYRRGPRKLTQVAAHYGVPLAADDAHDAANDAIAAGRLAFKLAGAYPVLRDCPLEKLVPWQAKLYAAWRLDFIRYREKQGQPVVIEPGWPSPGYNL